MNPAGRQGCLPADPPQLCARTCKRGTRSMTASRGVLSQIPGGRDAKPRELLTHGYEARARSQLPLTPFDRHCPGGRKSSTDRYQGGASSQLDRAEPFAAQLQSGALSGQSTDQYFPEDFGPVSTLSGKPVLAAPIFGQDPLEVNCERQG